MYIKCWKKEIIRSDLSIPFRIPEPTGIWRAVWEYTDLPIPFRIPVVEEGEEW